jgi:hypothetical protein
MPKVSKVAASERRDGKAGVWEYWKDGMLE